MCDPDTYLQFNTNVKDWRREFLRLYQELRKKKCLIYGYGSSGRANTICAYTRIWLDKIVDDAASKIGSYTPIYHQKIQPSSVVEDEQPDYVLILAWPYAKEIIRRHPNYRGKFIIPLPKVTILTNSL